jgi:sialate O-acetylesterase
MYTNDKLDGIRIDKILVLWLAVCLLFISGTAKALEISGLFADDAVLQRDKPVPVWGWAEPGVEVLVAFAGQKISAVTDDDGQWRVILKPLELNKKPQQLVVSSGQHKIIRKNILVGDVWLCAGQSNMQMTFKMPRLPCDLPEFVKPGDYPTIRHIAVTALRRKGKNDLPGLEPQERLEPEQVSGGWTVCDAEAYKGFTATGFFFAYTLVNEVDVPLGLLNITQGNTRIGSWVSEQSIASVEPHIPRKRFRAVYHTTPCTNYNMQIAPVAGFAIKGAIWYQGEANGKDGEEYLWKMKALIQGWRDAWGQGDFPFYYVQLPSYDGKGSWAPIREAQRKAMDIPNTGMVVLTDAGDTGAEFPINLHPRNKYVVGYRLAQWALANDYGKKDLVYSGPLFKSAAFKAGRVIVSFDHVGSGLMVAKKESSRSMAPPMATDILQGFEIAGKNGQWTKAKAEIQNDQVFLSAEDVPTPVAVRYLYSMNTDHGTLYNKAGLPASPFLAED